jgi:peptidoglycan-associated lipoprotein
MVRETREGAEMRDKVVFSMVVVIALSALVVTGCTKKTAEPETEMTPPAAAAPAAPAQEMKPTGTAPAAASVVPVLKEATTFDKKIYFGFDKFDLAPEAVAVLDELAAFLKANAQHRLNIEGHCDERGTNEYNLALGERRAKAALDYLVSQGIDAARLAAISYGEERPADPANTEEAWAQNRRDEFILGK